MHAQREPEDEGEIMIRAFGKSMTPMDNFVLLNHVQRAKVKCCFLKGLRRRLSGVFHIFFAILLTRLLSFPQASLGEITWHTPPPPHMIKYMRDNLPTCINPKMIDAELIMQGVFADIKNSDDPALARFQPPAKSAPSGLTETALLRRSRFRRRSSRLRRSRRLGSGS